MLEPIRLPLIPFSLSRILVENRKIQKFPVPGFSIPVIPHFFPVNLRREFAKKPLRHSGFRRTSRPPCSFSNSALTSVHRRSHTGHHFLPSWPVSLEPAD